MGLSRRDKKVLKQHLHDGKGTGQQENPQIVVAIVVQSLCSAQHPDQRSQKDKAKQLEGKCENGAGEDNHGKVFLGLLGLALTHIFCDDGASAGGEHDRHGDDNAGDGIDDVQGRQGVFPYDVGDENPVHHLIQGHEYQHNGGGQGKLNQAIGVEILG